MCAARILKLGLTAYGKTLDEALSKVVRMYASAVQAHRELGTLQQWLKRSGLTWSWEPEYKGDVPVHNADADIAGKRSQKALSGSASANLWESGQLDT